MALSIRPIEKSEQQRWNELFRAYGDFYKVSVTDATLAAVWHWVHDPDEPFWCDVATDGSGAVVGFTQYQLMHRSLGGGKVVYLSDLYADQKLRGGGIGKALIDHVIVFAKANGYANVRWLTQEFNYPARRLYDQYVPKSDFILYSVPTT